jgi:hypothetical protein
LDELNARLCAAGAVDDGERGSLKYPAKEVPAALLGKHVLRVAACYAVCVGVPGYSCVNVLPHRRSRGTEGETAAEPSGRGNGSLVITTREQMRRSVHRVVASGRYYGNPCYDNVLVAFSGEHESQLAAGIRVSSRSRAMHITHCAKALAFFRVPFLSEGGHVLLQYYDASGIPSTQAGRTGCTTAPNDACESHIGCVRLRWALNAHGQLFFDFLPVSSLRGRVQVVRGRIGLEETSNWSGANVEPSERWKHEFFYTNKFALRSGELYNLPATGAGSNT